MPPPAQKKARVMETSNRSKNESCGSTFTRIMLSHGGLFLIVCLYAVLGAYMFIDLEKPYEDRQNLIKNIKHLEIEDSKNYIIMDMWYQNTQNHTASKFKGMAFNNLRLFHNFVVFGVSNYNYDGKNDTVIDNWTFSSSLLFTVTTMGAIGYGHISPKTFKGQMFCIFYGLIGVPLLLVFLANIGDFLARSFRYIYSRGCCVACRLRRRVNEIKKGEKKSMSVFDDSVGDEVYMPTDEVQVPITVNVCVLTVYLMFGGLIFMSWEDWPFHSAAYFSFITLSTIGFGDYVPGSSFKLTDSPMVSGLKMAVTVFYSIFGMALLSMCINLIQEQIVTKFKWMSKELGMGNDEENEMKHKYRKTEHEVTTTAPDKDGNKNYHLQNLDDGPQKKFRRRPQSTESRGYYNLADDEDF